MNELAGCSGGWKTRLEDHRGDGLEKMNGGGPSKKDADQCLSYQSALESIRYRSWPIVCSVHTSQLCFWLPKCCTVFGSWWHREEPFICPNIKSSNQQSDQANTAAECSMSSRRHCSYLRRLASQLLIQFESNRPLQLRGDEGVYPSLP